VFFNKDTTEEDREALGWYHEKKSSDPERVIGLGLITIGVSHCADAFSLRCIHYDQPDGAPPRPE
jgi:phage terminase large subunit